MIVERDWTDEELAAMPEHPFLGPPPAIGQRVRCRIPDRLVAVHGGHRWLVMNHVRDAASPVIAGKLSSRLVLTYAPVQYAGGAAC